MGARDCFRRDERKLICVVRTCFDRILSALSEINGACRTTRDLYLTQRFARHSSPLTTTIYTHPTDEELYEGIRRLKA